MHHSINQVLTEDYRLNQLI